MRSTPLLILMTALSLAACGNKDKISPEGAAASGSAAPAPAPPKEDPALTFTAKAPAVGDKREEKNETNMSVELGMTLGAKTKQLKLALVGTTVKKVEVLAVEGTAVTKAKITYSEKTETETEDGKEKKKPKSPIQGKSYIFEKEAGRVLITSDSGKKVSAVEEKALRKEEGSFGDPDPLLEAMPKTPIKVGDKIDALSKALQDFVRNHDDSKEKPTVSDVEVKLLSIEGSGPEAVGVLSVSMTISSAEKSKDPVHIKVPLTGTMKLRAKDGWPTSVSLSGPVDMSMAPGKGDLSGKGTLTLNFEMTY